MKNRAGSRSWLIAVPLVGMACVILLEQRAARQAQEEALALRQQLDEAGQQRQETSRQLRAESKQAPDMPLDNSEGERLRTENRELLRLRNEVHLLHAQLKELQARLALQTQTEVVIPSTLNTARASTGRAWLGIQMGDLRNREELFGAKEGVVVEEIQTNSPAFSSDLNTQDVITFLDNQPITSPEQLKSALSNKVAGQVVSLDVLRKGVGLRVYLKTGEWPQ